MRTLGLIGGCSAEATSLYYAGLNRAIRAQHPGHGAKLLLWSFDVEEIDACCRAGAWTQAAEKFVKAALWLEAGGAEAVLICTNTMHRIAEHVEGALSVPLIHIGDVAANAVRRAERVTPLLLGTRYLMRETFYRDRLRAWDLDVRLPAPKDQELVHQIIYGELMDGRVTSSSKQVLAAIVERAIQEGADSVILGCTELGLALAQGDISVPLFDTAALHVAAGVVFALSGDSLN